MKHDFPFDDCRPDSDAPLIGWICSYTPEELIHAAGCIPFRLQPADAGTGADAWLPANFCPYVRSLLETGLTSPIENLQGMIFVHSCDAMRRLADIWSSYSKIPIYYRLDSPRRCDAIAEEYLVARYQELLTVLQQKSGRVIREEDLLESIGILNETRRLIGKISALRRSTSAPLSSVEFSDIIRCSTQSDKRQFNSAAERYLASPSHDAQTIASSPKILLCGCAADDREMYGLIESCGIRVVADDLCTGERHYDGLVDASLDPLRGIARRALRRRACSRMTGRTARISRLMEFAREHEVDGIILLSLKFCDLIQSDFPRIREAARHDGIPLLQIERDSLNRIDGQMRTRIQAFAEMMEKQQR